MNNTTGHAARALADLLSLLQQHGLMQRSSIDYISLRDVDQLNDKLTDDHTSQIESLKKEIEDLQDCIDRAILVLE